MDKIKGKLGFVLSMAFYVLFMYAYPYNSYLYGFSYLTVGMITVVALLIMVEDLYSKEKINKAFLITLIGITAFGLINSYCLFAPIVFASICIYTFMKDFKQEGKTYLKIFKSTTLIVTTVLFIVAVLGMLYYVVPAHFINGQKPITDSIKNDGAIYAELWRNIIYYGPFALLYAVTLVKKSRKIELDFTDVFAIIYIMFYLVMYIAMRLAVISPYYFYKTYFVLWIVIYIVTTGLINKYANSKGKFACLVKIYSIAWPVFVAIMIILKASTILPEETKRKIPNYVGMYFSENCDARGAFLHNLNFTNEQQEIANFVRENLTDITVENTVMITGTYNERCWATATTELSPADKEMDFRDVIQDTLLHHIKELYYGQDKKYAISFQGTNDYDKWPYKENLKVLFKNEAGYVVEKVEN